MIFLHPDQPIGVNRELSDQPMIMAQLGLVEADGSVRSMEERKAIEVGNIFKLGTRFSEACKLSFVDDSGQRRPLIMGCYGIGTSRLMGAVAETLSDDLGLRWPNEIAPFHVHLLSLARTEEEQGKAEELYTLLSSRGIEVLFDDRMDIRAGEKFVEADLLGIPLRFVVSAKTIAQKGVEFKAREAGKTEIVAMDEVVRFVLAAK